MEIQRDLLLAQLINFWILFFITKKFFGDKILNIVEERRVLIRKLKNADEEYERMIEVAKKESATIITNANKKKEDIIQEGIVIANQEKQSIIDLAIGKREVMLSEAKQRGEILLEDLEDQRTETVTTTTQEVVNKLFDRHVELKEAYLQTITAELKPPSIRETSSSAKKKKKIIKKSSSTTKKKT